jgi:hypothetical protein
MKTTVKGIPQMLLLLVLCVGFTSCNKDEYYEKEFLSNPDKNPETTGSVDNGGQGGVDSGAGGSTQGGVDAGVAGGATGGATTGSSSGGSTGGSTTGSTSGGSTTGGSTGGSTTGGTSGGSTTGGSTGSVSQTDNFQQADKSKLDILWIIDNSGSMADEQTALGTNFDAFINEFIDTNVDFKMAITTTDTSSSSKKGKMVTGSDTKLTSAKAQANPNQFKADFRNLVKVGTSGSGYEKGLAASEGFMEKYAASFIRPEAYLAVVVVTDEDDQSADAPKAYMDFLKSFKSNAGKVKLYSICDVYKRGPNTQGYTQGCDRYIDAANHAAGVVEDIYNDFYLSLRNMGESIINLLDSFALSKNPVVSSIVVKVNGNIETNYTYDASTRSIKFDANHVPAYGSNIDVTYQVQ